MEIENMKGEGNVAYVIRGIEGDMGERETMSLIQQVDGDVIVCISTPKDIYSVEFCSGSGGGRRPVIAKKLKELMAELVEACSIEKGSFREYLMQIVDGADERPGRGDVRAENLGLD